MAGVSTILWNSKLAKSQPYNIRLYFTVTSGATAEIAAIGYPAIIGEAATPFTQAATNTLLELDSTGAALSSTSTAEITATTVFGATAMGTDAWGFVLMCSGQVRKALWLRGILHGSSGDATLSDVKGENTSEPTNSLANAFYKTPAGNLCGRLVITGLDALSAGFLEVEACVLLK